jgi:transglutaminase-like putative cysteine protease
MDNYLKATELLDYKHPEFQLYLEGVSPVHDPTQLPISLYQYVRDGFLYDPYHLDLRPNALKASAIVGKRRAWCVEKSIVLAAAFRAFGIPSRLGYGIVVNHIGVEKLTHYLRRPEIVFHGYVDAFIQDKWVKCTPAFDPVVCRISGVSVLDWDGETDALLQAYSAKGKFMEYLHFYGHFDDVPVELMNAEMKKYYPHLFEDVFNTKAFSFFHLDV